MDPQRFDAFLQTLSAVATRRRTLAALVGMALLETGLGTAVAKREPQYQGTSHGKGRRHGKKKRKGNGRARAQAKTKSGNHCISPSTGIDLNEYFGISAQIVTAFCPKVGSGEQWTTGGPWFMAQSFEAVPEGFIRAGNTPLEDFIAKFTALKLMIDPGSKYEKTVVFPNDGNLFVDTGFNGAVLVSPTTLGTVQPLPIGDHVVDVYWVFSAMHCDGFDDDPTVNCFPAGETRYIPGLAFEVTPGHHS